MMTMKTFADALDEMRALAWQEMTRFAEMMGDERPNGKALSRAQEEARDARRQEVRRMWKDGERVETIRRAVGCSRNTVVNDLVAMRLWRQ